MAFSFSAPLNREQADFLQRHALATAITFGAMSANDALAVLNCPAFAERNSDLLQQLQHLEVAPALNLAPYKGERVLRRQQAGRRGSLVGRCKAGHGHACWPACD